MQQAQADHAAINGQLDRLELEQDQLESFLDKYEKELQTRLNDTSKPLVATNNADKARSESYKLAEDLNGQLNDLSSNLTNMIDEVNRLSTSGQQAIDGDDPINQLSSILGAHLRALQSIDGNSARLDEKVTEIEARMGSDRGRYGLARR